MQYEDNDQKSKKKWLLLAIGVTALILCLLLLFFQSQPLRDWLTSGLQGSYQTTTPRSPSDVLDFSVVFIDGEAVLFGKIRKMFSLTI